MNRFATSLALLVLSSANLWAGADVEELQCAKQEVQLKTVEYSEIESSVLSLVSDDPVVVCMSYREGNASARLVIELRLELLSQQAGSSAQSISVPVARVFVENKVLFDRWSPRRNAAVTLVPLPTSITALRRVRDIVDSVGKFVLSVPPMSLSYRVGNY